MNGEKGKEKREKEKRERECVCVCSFSSSSSFFLLLPSISLYKSQSGNGFIAIIKTNDLLDIIFLTLFFSRYFLLEDPSGWWQGRVGEREGLFPANYVEEVSEA